MADKDYNVSGMGRTGTFKMSADAWGHYSRLHAAVKSPGTSSNGSRAVVGQQTSSGSLSKRGYDRRGMN